MREREREGERERDRERESERDRERERETFRTRVFLERPREGAGDSAGFVPNVPKP